MAVFALEAVLWTSFGTSDNGWAPERTFAGPVVEALTKGPLLVTLGVVVSLLVFIGVVSVFLRRTPVWRVVGYGLTVVLFAIANGAPRGPAARHHRALVQRRVPARSPAAGRRRPPRQGRLTLLVGWTDRASAGGPGDPTARRSRAAVAAGTALVLLIAILGTQFSNTQRARGQIGDASIDSRTAARSSPGEVAIFSEVPGSSRPTRSSPETLERQLPRLRLLRPRCTVPPPRRTYPEEHWAVAEGLGEGDPAACAAAEASASSTSSTSATGTSSRTTDAPRTTRESPP